MKKAPLIIKMSLLFCFFLTIGTLFGQTNCPSNLEKFDWLPALINPDDCCANTRVLTYTSGIFTFVYIEKDTTCEESSNELYFEDGTYYCSDINGMDCRVAYNLTMENETVLWDCDAGCSEPDCSKNIGTIFLAPCDNGAEFFFIRTENGTVLDPYFAPDFFFDYYDGQRVKFDFKLAPFAAPCSNASQAIMITCIEDAVLPANSKIDIFSIYPWLTDLVNRETCNIKAIKTYKKGASNFLYLESNDGNILYLEDGTFYCVDAPNFDCIALYNLTNLIDEWFCDGAINEADAPVSDLNKMTICAGDTAVFDYPFAVCDEAPLIFMQSGGVFPQDLGNYYISELENKIYFYPLTTVSYLMNPYPTGPEVIPTIFETYCGNRVFEITVATNCMPDNSGNLEGRPLTKLSTTPSLPTMVFPNPTTGFFQLQLPAAESEQQLRVFDLHGRQLKELTIERGTTIRSIDLSTFENGVYWLELLDGQEREMLKVVKQ